MSTPRKRPIETITLDSSSDEEQASRRRRPLLDQIRPRASTSPRPRSRPDLEDNDEAFNRDLEAAIQASLATENQVKVDVNQQTLTNTDDDNKGKGKGNEGSISRAQMEKERLERLAKRLDVPGRGPVLTSSSESDVPSNSLNRPRFATLSDPSPSSSSSNDSPSATCSTSSPRRRRSTFDPATSQRFWSGTIRSVSNGFHPDPTGSNSLSFASLIGPTDSLRASIVSAFVLDPNWVVPQFPRETPLLLIMPRPRGDTNPDRFAQVSLRDKRNLYRAIPVMREVGYNGFSGCMHTKLIVHFHEDFCRIVIPTANMVDYDWDQIDNAFYVQDFPVLDQERLPSREEGGENASPYKNKTLTQFSENFIQIVQKLGASKGFLKFFNRYDFSRSDKVRLVHSVQGKYTEPAKYDSGGGLCSLAKGVAGMGFAKGGKWAVEATGSSIGQYSPTWLLQFLASCSGIHPSTYFSPPTTRLPPLTSPRGGFPHSLPPKGQRLNPNSFPLRIVFPTQEEIADQTRLGVTGGGTIFCKKAGPNGWEGKSFPRELFWKGQSKRNGIAAHTKMILATHTVEASPASPEIYEGWLYVGSHNFTPSAWGSLQQDGKTKEPQLAINNYELGVILPIRADSKEEFEKKASEMVTYKRPLTRYSATDRPWMQAEYPALYPGQK